MSDYQYAITDGSGSHLAAALDPGDPTATMIGPLANAIAGRRYNVVIESEIIGFTDCHLSVWQILERGVGPTAEVSHPLGAAAYNQLDADYLLHLNGGGLVVVERQTKTVAEPEFDFDLTAVPDNAESIVLRVYGSQTHVGLGPVAFIWMEVNGDTGSNYNSQWAEAADTTVDANSDMADSSVPIGALPTVPGGAAAGSVGYVEITIPYFRDATRQKLAVSRSVYSTGGSAGDSGIRAISWAWTGTDPITSVQLGCFTDFEVGCTAVLYAEVGLSLPSGVDARESVAGKLFLAANFL